LLLIAKRTFFRLATRTPSHAADSRGKEDVMSSHSAPTRTLPDKPSLAQLRKLAKELLKSYRGGKDAAIAEVERFERKADPAKFALADAQRVLARAYGLSSWTQLKKRVDIVSNVKAFCQAVKAGDVATVRKLVKPRPELVHEWRGDAAAPSALLFAVLHRDADMTRALIELSATPRTGFWPHRDATSAYTIAKDRGYDEIVAVIEEEEERRRRESSPAGATISSKTDEILKAIVQDRCDEAIRILQSDLSLVGACNHAGTTPLHIAAFTHNPVMVAWLLNHGAPVDAKAPTDVPVIRREQDKVAGRTPLDHATIVAGWSAHGRHFTFMETSHKPPAVFDETVRLLRLKGAELTARAAVAIGDKEAVLQRHREGRLKNEIHCLRGGLVSIAVRVNRIDMVSLLLDVGFDPNESFDDAGTSWGMPLWFAALCGRHEIAELLLTRGADVNAIVFASGDALGNAQATQDEKMQALLLKHGARITVEHVAGGEKGRETAKAILAGNLPAYSLNVDDPTPTDLAEQMLWAAGPGDPEIVRMCLPHMKRPRDDPWWNYVLIHAALPGSFKLILDHDVDPDVVGDGGFTILHHLATDYANQEHRVTRATMVLEAGASLSKRDPLLKSTPLGWACRWGRIELVKLYMVRGADTVEADAEPWATPVAWATKGGHREIIELLRSRDTVAGGPAN
jgi:ankyrin repeat protein